jgi:rhamnose transport system permease protein
MTDTSKDKTDFVARIGNWDNFLAALTILVIVYAVFEVPNFASTFNISQAVAGISERALIVLPMVFLIIAREIDLSVGSTLALTSVVFGLLTQAEFPLVCRYPADAACGCGLRRVQRRSGHGLGLPSLVVTLGTMALFRGIGYILLGSGSINDFPDSFLDFGINTVGDTPFRGRSYRSSCSRRCLPSRCRKCRWAAGSTRLAAAPKRLATPASGWPAPSSDCS